MTPETITCHSLSRSLSLSLCLSVCSAIKAYISVTMSWILMKFGESVGILGPIDCIKISLRYAARALCYARMCTTIWSLKPQPKMLYYPKIVISDFYRHSLSVTPFPIICLSVCLSCY